MGGFFGGGVIKSCYLGTAFPGSLYGAYVLSILAPGSRRIYKGRAMKKQWSSMGPTQAPWPWMTEAERH